MLHIWKMKWVFFGLLKLRKTSLGWTPTSVLPCSLTHHMRCPPSLPKSISPSFPPSRTVSPSHMEIQRLINAATPLSLTALSPSFFPPFIPPSLPPAFLSRSSSVSVLRPALITHNPSHPLHPPDDMWAAFSLALSSVYVNEWWFDITSR